MGKMYTEFAIQYDEAIQNNAYNALYERPNHLNTGWGCEW